MTTVDVEIEIGRNTGASYPVVARAGDEVANGQLPVASVGDIERQLGEVRAAVLASSAGPEAAETEQRVRALGRQMFDSLVNGDVRKLYAAGVERAAQDSGAEEGSDGGALRLVLGVRPAELSRLPWEFLFDPDREKYLGLSLLLVRYPEVLAPRQPLPLTRPLRILGMSVHPSGLESSGVDAPRQRLRTALAGLTDDGALELGWVSGHGCGDLESALNEGCWNALHLTSFGADTGNEDFSRLIADTHFARLIADHDTLRLVLLNASVTASAASAAEFANAARVLVRRGVPAVVTMQSGITDQGASRFAEVLYHAVAKGLPVDVGVLRARRALRTAWKRSLEWVSPALYSRSPGGQVFQVTSAANQEGPRSRYDQALEAFWTERWGMATGLFQEVLTTCPDHPDAAAKLEQSARERDLVSRYARACAAVEAGDWEQAVTGLAEVADADPTNWHVRDRLEEARREWDRAVLTARSREEGAGQEVSPPPAPRLILHSKPHRILHTPREVNAVAFAPDGARLATAGSKNLVQVWDVSTGQEVLSLRSKSRRRAMEGVLFSPDGGRLATASDDGTARIWDADSGEERLKVDVGEPVWAVAFSPDGGRLATASDDGTARVWNAANGSELVRVNHDNWVRGVAFSPDGDRMATASVDHTARSWDATSGAELVRVEHEGLVWGVTFSPDGRWLATAGQDGTARIWDADSGEELLAVLLGDQVWAVAFSPDGLCLATACDDRTARLFDVANGQELAAVVHVDPVWTVAFSPDGSLLATGSVDRTVRLMLLEVEF